MKAEELFRNVPANIHELYLALAGLPKDMEVKADAETGVPEKTVEELWARTTWPPGLVITTPRKVGGRGLDDVGPAFDPPGPFFIGEIYSRLSFLNAADGGV
jgi:hypothetical protein